MSVFPYKRIIVIGTTSAGKTTLADRLSKRLGLDFIELDALHWEPNWQEATSDVFRTRVENAVQSAGWVVAGNYHVARDLIWPLADAAIWLDYPFHIIFGRLWNRTWRRWWHQEELWNGNVERLWVHFKLWSDDSLFKWLFKTYWRRKRDYPQLLSLPEYCHIYLIRFMHPTETDAWFESL
jgi:adenylate kinase family enzyme